MDNAQPRMDVPAHSGRNVGNQMSDVRAVRPKKARNEKLKLAAFVTGFVLLIAAITCGFLVFQSGASGSIDGSKYQAVFLSNGQVYFGKLSVKNGEYLQLNKIFYLQTKDTTDKSQNPQNTDSTDTNVQLIKLGSEVHGPDDEMIISKSQVLFFENLKTDGTVTKSITKYYSDKKS